MNHTQKLFTIFLSILYLVGGYVTSLAEIIKEGQIVTYYYEMEKEVSKEGEESPRTGEGQFYTITHNTCYESDRDGMDEGLGHLTYYTFNKERRLHIYDGTCYCGKAIFYFSEDYSRINIKTESGHTYVLARKTAPKSFVASNHKEFKQQIDGLLRGGTVTTPILTTVPTIESVPEHPHSTIEYYDCPSCYGSGKCPICHGSGKTLNSYTGEYMRCPSCRNGNCSACNGTGKKSRIKR